MDELTRRRLARNEELFRSVNDQVEELQARLGGSDALFVCECSDPECTSSIRLTTAEYEAVRSEDDRFVLLRGHENTELERVIEEHDAYVVVRKPERLLDTLQDS